MREGKTIRHKHNWQFAKFIGDSLHIDRLVFVCYCGAYLKREPIQVFKDEDIEIEVQP